MGQSGMKLQFGGEVPFRTSWLWPRTISDRPASNRCRWSIPVEIRSIGCVRLTVAHERPMLISGTHGQVPGLRPSG
jgi:hypothetical protein